MEGLRILITGNLGYVGPVVVKHLRTQKPDVFLAGFDTGYFSMQNTSLDLYSDNCLDVQYYGDVRNFPTDLLKDFDVVVHLAAISNDPIGNRFETVTTDVNFHSSVEIARAAKKNGVRKFVFASSCSVYGAGGSEARNESSAVTPLTAYAKSKVNTETALKELASPEFSITCLRFATACGMSPRLRLDLVLNDFVASACTSGEINILSDGSPWRPLIHVRDMARAIEWASGDRSKEYLVVNAGSSEWNYQIKDLAECVKQQISGCNVKINDKAEPDLRSYQVDFSLYKSLAPEYYPQVMLPEAIVELKTGLEKMAFNDRDFRSGNLMRLNLLQTLLATGRLKSDFNWN